MLNTIPSAFRKLFAYTAVFLLGFLSVFLLYTGLPYDFTADYMIHIQTIQNLGAGELTRLTLNPLTPAWFFMEEIVRLRPLSFLYPMLMDMLFGIGPASLQTSEALYCGLLCCLIFYFVRRSTQSSLYSWLALCLLLTFPSNYFAISAFPYFEYFNTLLRIVPIILLGYLTLSKKTGVLKFIGLAICWYVLVLTAIKLRSSEKILPFIFLSFLSIRFHPILRSIGAQKYGLLIGVALFMLISVIPLNIFEPADKPSGQNKTVEITAPSSPAISGSIRKENMIKRFSFYSLYTALISKPNDPFYAVTLLKKEPPTTLTKSFGPFLGVGFWLFLLIALIQLFQFQKRTLPTLSQNTTEWLKHYFILFLIWFTVTAAGFGTGFAATAVRYLNFILTPALLLFFFSLAILEASFSKSRFQSQILKCLRLFILIGALITMITNGILYLKLWGHFGGGMTSAIVEAEKTIYKDYYHQDPTGYELYHSHPELLRSILLMEWHKDWPSVLEDITPQLKKGDFFYFLTMREDSPGLRMLTRKGYSPSLMREINFLDASPVGFRISKRILSLLSKESDRQIYVYKISV